MAFATLVPRLAAPRVGSAGAGAARRGKRDLGLGAGAARLAGVPHGAGPHHRAALAAPPAAGGGARENCRTVPVVYQERRLVGYDVEYVYKGEKYMSRLAADPGARCASASRWSRTIRPWRQQR
jgi:hypothetical protein